MIARWPGRITAGRTVDDPVNVAGLAPTFLEVAGLEPPAEMSVRSILDLLGADGSGYLGDHRTEVYAGMAWHAQFHPMRMTRTRTHLYIENHHSGPRRPRRVEMESRAPAYEEGYQRYNPHQSLMRHPEHPAVRPHREKCYGPRPRRELYEIATDPDNLDNLAEEPEQRSRIEELAGRLEARLEATGDPRATGHPEVFEEIVAAVEKARGERD